MRSFERTFRITSSTRILDVGGSPEIWQFVSVLPDVTLLNFPSALSAKGNGYAQIAADGLLLPFRDKSFDIVFSNSVIEHVGKGANQRQFAEEIRRVGKSYWVQTPNRNFPIEMHLMLPGVHFLSPRLQRGLVYRFTGWEKLARPTMAEKAYYLEHFLNELCLLDGAGVAALFPDATVLRERWFGLTKALIAVRS